MISFVITFRNKLTYKEFFKNIDVVVVGSLSYFDAWKICIDEIEPELCRLGYDWYIKSIHHVL